MSVSKPKCSRLTCFANIDGLCDVLIQVKDNCSFYKRDGSITNGTKYPYNPTVTGMKLDFDKLRSNGFNVEGIEK